MLLINYFNPFHKNKMEVFNFYVQNIQIIFAKNVKIDKFLYL